jgi:hypothetical protein
MQIRKKGGMKLKKSSSLKLQSQSQPNFAEMRFTSKLQVKKKIDRRVEPPDTFLEENHPMTISSKFKIKLLCLL